MNGNGKMRPRLLKIRNFQAIEALDIDFDAKGDVLTLSGKNGSGKTSVADFVRLIKEALPNHKVIRKGATVADGEFEAGDADTGLYHVDVVVKPDGKGGETKEVSVKMLKRGRTMAANANVFKTLFGAAAYPLKYVEETANAEGLKRLAKMLKSLATYPEPDTLVTSVLGVEHLAGESWLDSIARARKKAYDERTDANATVRSLDPQLAAIRIPDEFKDARPVKVNDLIAQRDALQAQKAANQKERDKCEAINSAVFARANKIEDLKQELRNLEEEQRVQVQELRSLEKTILSFIDPDTADLDAQIANAETVNAWAGKAETAKKLSRSRLSASAEADGLTERIEELDKLASSLNAGAKLPVPGITFDDEQGFLVDGQPVAARSRGQRWLDCSLIAMADPAVKIGLLVVDDAEGIDSKTKKLIVEEAKKRGFTVVFLKFVDEQELRIE